MVKKSVENITNGTSINFDYLEDFYNNSQDIIDYEDVICELQSLYDVEIYKSIAPVIWCSSLWEDDENYDEYNQPELWRLEID